MKRVIFIIVFLLAVVESFSQNGHTIHAIIFADTDDKSIGKAAGISSEKFANLLHDVEAALNYNVKDDDKYRVDDGYCRSGMVCRKEYLMEVLNDFRCDTGDIVVFCYLGHGGRSTKDTSIFPQMCLHEEKPENYVPIEYVKNRLASHGARLTLIIGDCCNTFDENIKTKPLDCPTTNLSGSTINIMKILFKEYQGVITMCAADTGKYGWCNEETGMYFNNSLIDNIESTRINAIIPGRPWESVMNSVKMELGNKTFTKKNDSKIYRMNPIYKIEPRQSCPHCKGGVIPGDVIKLSLVKIADRGKTYQERINSAENIKHLFSSNARIYTVTRDGKIHDTFSPEDYINHLIASENIINIDIRNVRKTTEGKVISLCIHEICIVHN